MAGILVYLPNSPTDSTHVAHDLRTRGLGGLLDERHVDAIPTLVRKGPDGGSGRLVTFNAIGLPNTPREYAPDAQEWIQEPAADEGGRYWLGCVKAARPTPGELQRLELLDGEPVTLRDGNQWIIPIADFLPKRLTRDPRTGEETRVTMDTHREFADWANAIFDLFLSDGFQAMVQKELVVHIPKGLTFASMALAKNYRLNVDAVDLLGLIGEVEAFEIAKVACGLLTLERAFAQKKTTGSPSQEPAPNY